MNTHAIPDAKNFEITLKIKEMLMHIDADTIDSTASYILEQDKFFHDMVQFMIVHLLSHSTQHSVYLHQLWNKLKLENDNPRNFNLVQSDLKNIPNRSLLTDYENKLPKEFLEAMSNDNLDLYISLGIENSSKAQKYDDIIANSSTNFISNRLALAASLNAIKIYKYLISRGCVPNKFTLEAAVKGSSMDLFKLLYNRKMVSPETIKRSFENVHSEIPRFLMNELCVYDQKYLVLAIKNYHVDLFIEIWNKCVQKPNFNPNTQLLFEAVNTRNIEVLRFLAEEQKMNIKAINPLNGKSLVYEAYRVESQRIAKYLIINGAEPFQYQGNNATNPSSRIE